MNVTYAKRFEPPEGETKKYDISALRQCNLKLHPEILSESVQLFLSWHSNEIGDLFWAHSPEMLISFYLYEKDASEHLYNSNLTLRLQNCLIQHILITSLFIQCNYQFE